MSKVSRQCKGVNEHGWADLSEVCFGMDAALNEQDPKSRIGITAVEVNQVEGKTLKFRGHMVCAFSGSKKKNGLVMNLCPWCGERLYKDMKKPRDERERSHMSRLDECLMPNA